MRLTARRTRVLGALLEYAHLTTAQFYVLFGAAEEPAQRALRRVLHDFTLLGCLRRARLLAGEAQADRLPHWEFIYWLSPAGLDQARAEGLDPHAVGKASEARSPFMLAHEREISRFHVLLNRAVQEKVWWRQRELKHSFASQGPGYSVNPDALFYFGGYYYFLELERSRQGHYRDGESGLLKKVRSYLEYARTASYRERWPHMHGFFLLFVVASAARQANLLEALRVRYPQSLLRVATVDACRADVLGGIWQSPKDCREGRVHSLRTAAQVRP